MARYTLPQYQSVYRDPGSVQVNTMLRDRFANAVVADDALTASVDGMQSADYDGDNQLKNELAEEYNAKLEERARRGDYETAGMSITKDSRGFLKSYQPIQQNFGKVQDYQATLKEQLSKGDISEEQYSKGMSMSNQDYSGLQKKDDGTIDEDSYFSGTRMVKYQDISALIDKRMEAVEAQEGGSEVRRVGVGENAQYERLVGNTWEIITQERVDAVVNDVLSDPNVKAYLNQVGDMRSYNAKDEDIKNSLTADLFGDPEDVEDKGLVGQLDELIASGKEDKETVAMMDQLQDRINSIEDLLPGEGEADSPEMIARRKQALKSNEINMEVNRKVGVARATHMMDNRTSKDLMYHDELYKIDYKNKVDNYIADFSVPLESIQVDNPGGITVESINGYMNLQDQSKVKVVDLFNSNEAVQRYIESGDGAAKYGEAFKGFTEEQILNGDVPDELKGIIGSTQMSIKRANLEKEIQQKLLNEAYEASGYSLDTDKDAEEKFLTTTFKGTFGIYKQSITGQQMIDSINKLYGENMGYEEALEKFNSLQKIANTYGKANAEPGRAKEAMEAISRLNAQMKKDYNIQGGNNRKELVIDDMIQFRNNYMLDRNEKIGGYLKKNAKRQVSGMGSTVAPGFTSDQQQATTKVFNDYFKTVGLERSLNIGYGGSLHTGTGTVDSFRAEISSKDGLGKGLSKEQRESWATGSITVAKVLFNKSPGPDGGGVTLIVKNGMGGTSQIHVPKSSFENTQMSAYMNTPIYRAAEMKNRAKNKGVDNFSFKIKGGGEILFDFKTDGGDYVTFSVPEVGADGQTRIKSHSVLSTSQEFFDELTALESKGLLPF
tara:strand:- start:2373 stop:4877 length:2505 start_codon:yes stop_codon:yes gene_type:complete